RRPTRHRDREERFEPCSSTGKAIQQNDQPGHITVSTCPSRRQDLGPCSLLLRRDRDDRVNRHGLSPTGSTGIITPKPDPDRVRPIAKVYRRDRIRRAASASVPAASANRTHD